MHDLTELEMGIIRVKRAEAFRPVGRNISAQGKRKRPALGTRRHESEALKGQNNLNRPKAAGQQPLVPPFQGFMFL